MIDDELLHKWINKTISQEELAEFKQRPEFESLASVYQNTDDLESPSFDGDAMLKAILNSKMTTASTITSEQEKTHQSRRIFPWAKLAIAASFLLLLGFFFWPGANLVSHEVARNEHFEGELPDQSSFVLNAESTLAYAKKGWENKRELQLKGEAFFRVRKGSTFTVKTPQGKVEVLGTAFNVKARAGKFEVSCVEGKVAVFSRTHRKKEELIAGQTIRINEDGTVERKEGISNNANSWVKGITKLDNVSTAELIAELERQFDVEFETGKIDLSQKITCNFQHQDLNLALQTSLATLGIKFEALNNNKVILK